MQEIDDVPANGEIYSSAIMGGSPTGETINVELKLWPKSTYSGSTTTFVGELTPEIKRNLTTIISYPVETEKGTVSLNDAIYDFVTSFTKI